MHFTGTIVASKNTDNYFEVVDGQQRLTTIYILISQFKELKDNPKYRKFFNNLLNQKVRTLKLNKETDKFFEKCLFDNVRSKGLHKSENNIHDAIVEFENWIEENQENAEKYLKAILNKLGLLFYSPLKKDEVSIMFEVINNRGKPLSQLEKVKNYLVYYSTKHGINLHEKINRNWGDLLINLQGAGQITNEQEDAFLRNCWLVYAKPVKKESYKNYRNLKEKFPIEENYELEIEKFFNFLLKCSEYYSTLFSTGKGVHEKLRYHPALGSVMPLYLSICFWTEEHKIDNITAKIDNITALDLLEKLNFRIYTCPEVTKRSDKHQTMLFSWSHQLYINNIYDIDENNELYAYLDKDIIDRVDLIALDKLEHYFKAFIKRYCSTEEFVKSLTLDLGEGYNYYQWPGLKLFLANYEVYLANKYEDTENITDYLKPKGEEDQGNDPYEREHIWAKKNRDEIKNSIHEKSRLGNFVLLQKKLNITASTSDLASFEKIPKTYLKNDNRKLKIKIYEEFQKPLRQVKELQGFHDNAKHFVEDSKRNYENRFFDYYQEIIDLRETELITFAFDRWGIDDKEKKLKYIIDSKLGEKENDEKKDLIKVYYLESVYNSKSFRRFVKGKRLLKV